MQSVWKESIQTPEFPTLKGEISTDILIIGGGMTGILCAYLFEQAGIDYILVEADKICHGITMDTTAKITSQHGLIYDKLIKDFDDETAHRYLLANELAIKKYREICSSIDCDFEDKSAYVYSKNDRKKLEDEIRALDRIGYGAVYQSDIPLPIQNVGAVRYKKQAQFNPLKFVAEISKSLNIYEHTKVTELGVKTAKINDGMIHAEQIIVATHFPITNKYGAYFLKMYQERSYVLGLEDAQVVNGMYIDEEKNGLSFRNYKNLLLLGGGGHRTGKKGGNYKELSDFVERHYPDSKEKYRWATQDCMTLDNVPYIGMYGKNTYGFYVATGYNKWGMTTSMVAATVLRDTILGVDNDYSQVFDPHRSMFQKQLCINAFEAITNLLTISTKRCPHMGCALKWNAVEHTWDCPCHGSRFTREGKIINNPATDDLQSK